MTEPIESGCTIDGTPIPIDVEAHGPDAIAAYLEGTTPPVIETAPNPPAFAEGEE